MVPGAQARLGETQAAIEARLLAANVGLRMPSEDAGDPRVRHDRPPYEASLGFLPSDARVARYWKSALSRQISKTDGWEIHVVLVGGVSVLEAYKRVGSGLSEFEVNGLLNLHKGGSRWMRVASEQTADSSVLRHTLAREDGEFRANRQGNWFMIFSTKLDEFAVARQAEARAEAERRREEQRKIDAQRAPESLAGF